MDLVRYFEQQQIKTTTRPRLKAGDIVRVETKITEGEKTRLQTFEGTILGIRGSGPSASFTVRRETAGFAVERIFPVYSPLITSIEIIKRQKVRRAKLHYLRHAGRRRIKKDELSMQRHVKEEADKKRLAAEAKKRVQDEEVAAEAKAKRETEQAAEALKA
ncbi:MAG: 50S ribosomal protein L19 [Candidatus Andersenbacteria bacterium]